MSQPPEITKADLAQLELGLSAPTRRALDQTVEWWVRAKEGGGKVIAAIGSGPHLHEGVTVQLAELMRLGVLDGVLTSAAVVGHELGGVLERVRRVDGRALGWPERLLPLDGRVEVSLDAPRHWDAWAAAAPLDRELYERLAQAPGREIIKVGGNLAYPSGLVVETLAPRVGQRARELGQPFEAVVGPSCDPRTMLGAAAAMGLPCLVTTPQLVGGGKVGLAIGDSVGLARRSELVARALDSAELIIESGLALAQEIHDGPLELATGHGLWSAFEGGWGWRLDGKKVARIDLDPNLGEAWRRQRQGSEVAQAIDLGRPKAAELGLPFRMEMSGFARLPQSLPILADLGAVWPLLACKVSAGLGVKPGFVCYKQGNPPGEAVRRYIVDEVRPLDVTAWT